MKTSATCLWLSPTKFQSTLMNLNILSHSGWLMLLFTLVKSCFNVYEVWKESSQLSVISQTWPSWTPTYCDDAALWSKPVFWNPRLKDKTPSFPTLALICPEVDTLRINLCDVSSCSPSLSDDSSPASPVWKKMQFVRITVSYRPTDGATTSGGFYKLFDIFNMENWY